MCTWECEVLKKYLMTTMMKFEHVDILCGLSYFDATFPAAGKKQQLCGGLDVNNDSVSSLESPGLVAQFLLAYVYFTSLWREGGGWAFIFICLNINVMNLISHFSCFVYFT